MIDVTVSAVSKVVVAVCLGSFTSQKIPNAAVTVRDFSYVLANILLPSLTFYNTASSVDLRVLLRCSVLLLFAFSIIGFGLICGAAASRVLYRVDRTGIPREMRGSLHYTLTYRDAEGMNISRAERQRQERRRKKDSKKKINSVPLLRPVVGVVVGGALELQRVGPEEVLPLLEPPAVEWEEQPFYHYATLIACSLQNTVTLHLSLLQTIADSLPWIDVAVGTSYIFIYSVACSVCLWSLGPMFVDSAKKEMDKRRQIRTLLELHKKLRSCRSVATQTEVSERISLSATASVSRVAPLPRRNPSTGTRMSTTIESTTTPPGQNATREEAENMPEVSSENSCDAGEQTNIPAGTGDWFLTPTPASCEAFHYDWKEEGLLRVVYASEFKETEKADRNKSNPCMNILRGLKNITFRLLQTPAFTSVVAGFIVGITPPLRWLLFEGPLSVLMDSIGFVAGGSIPSSLLLLGTNLVGSASIVTKKSEIRLREAEQNTVLPLDEMTADPNDAEMYSKDHEDIEFDEHASFTLLSLQQQQHMPTSSSVPVSTSGGCDGSAALPNTTSNNSGGVMDSVVRIFAINNVWKTFIFGCIFMRLFFIPAAGYVLVIILRAWFPALFGNQEHHNILLLILLAELSGPTALNCTILFNARDFMPEVWSKMLFFLYLTCTFTFMLWCSLALAIAT